MTAEANPVKPIDQAQTARRGRPPQQIDWRIELTSAERADLEGLEKNAHDLDDRRKRLSHEIRLLRDRAIARRIWRRRVAARKAAAE